MVSCIGMWHWLDKKINNEFCSLCKSENKPLLLSFQDKSKCALVARKRVFRLLNELCNKFDGDGTISHQPGVMKLCADLIRSPAIACEFWTLYNQDEQCGVVSLWNSALEFFPFNFSALSVLAAGLAQAGKCSVRNVSVKATNSSAIFLWYQVKRN